MITIPCPCGETYHADERYAGREILCKNCNRRLPIQLQEPIGSWPSEPRVQKAEPEIVRDYQATPPRRNARRVKSALVFAIACVAFFCLALLVWLKQGSQNPPVLPQSGTAAGSPVSASPSIPLDNGTDRGSPAHAQPPVSLENGTELMGFDGTGLGSLTISNGTSLDAVAKLRTSADVNVCEVYIKAGHEWTIEKVPPGTYTLLFGLGVDWDVVNRRFLRSRTYSKFAETFAFTETPHIDGVVYSRFEVTLNPVPEGQARTLQIDEKEFEGNGYRSQQKTVRPEPWATR